MFGDLNRTIEALLKSESAGDVASQVLIGFATPGDSFPPQGLSLPAISLFLFEVRENAALRELEPVRERCGKRFAVLAIAAIQELKTSYDARLDALERRLATREGKS